MIVGPTVFTVTNGNGAPARWISSKRMNWSIALRPSPPYSFGQPIPSIPSRPIVRTTSRKIGLPSPALPSWARTVGRQQPLEVLANLGAERLLLGGGVEEQRTRNLPMNRSR